MAKDGIYTLRCSCCKQKFQVFVTVSLENEGDKYTLKAELFPIAQDWPPARARVRQPKPQYVSGADLLRDPEVNTIPRHPDFTHKQVEASRELAGRDKNCLCRGKGEAREFRDTDAHRLNMILKGEE